MKPLVTCILFAYNQEKYIEEAVKSILNQDYSNLEIILSDDCSPDKTYRKICNIVENQSTNHKVSINQNQKNLGLTAHFNKLVEQANGDIIVVAAGDDISLNDRVTKTVELFSKYPTVSFVSFNDIVIDDKGTERAKGQRVTYEGTKLFNLEDFINKESIPFSGASRAFRKEVYNTFGALNEECPTEDTPYIIRGLMLGSTAISSDIAIKYRKHQNNLSNPDSIAKMSIDAISQQYLKDINTALSNKIISSRDAKALKNWVITNDRNRKAVNALESSNHKTTYLLKNILLSSKYNSKFKISLAKNLARNKFKDLKNKFHY